VESRLQPGALIVADNADHSPDYLARACARLPTATCRCRSARTSSCRCGSIEASVARMERSEIRVRRFSGLDRHFAKPATTTLQRDQRPNGFQESEMCKNHSLTS
jgi:hypothetical protein